MALMRYVTNRAGIYGIRIDLPKSPPSVRAHFGVTAIWKSLGTADKAEAFDKAGPQIAALLRQIETVKKGQSGPAAPPQAIPRLSPDEAHRAIEGWKNIRIQAAYLDAFNRMLEPVADPVAYSDMMYALQQGQEPEGLTELLASALGVSPDFPVLGQPHLRQWFREAWLEAERRIAEFRREDFGNWSDETVEPPQKPAQVQASSTKLNALVSLFLASQSPSEASDISMVWKRLVEFFGDVSADRITPLMADEFAIAVRKYPVTRKPDVLKLPMREIVEHPIKLKLSPKSVWKWLGLVNRVFTWGVSRKLVAENHFAVVMPKKPGKGNRRKNRREFKAEEISTMFSAPMFTGFRGTAEPGYREEPGTTILKDEKYWIPLFGLYHGCRLEEIGGARLDELEEINGVAYFDWRHSKRPFKTDESKRCMPIHPAMNKLGWKRYVAERRKSGDIHLFPNLPHDLDHEDPDASTRNWSKWWGRWMDAHKLPDPDIDFHAFRHTFITACRGKIDAELRDFIVGHKGKGSEGREYGSAEMEMLSKQLAKVKYDCVDLF